MECVKDCLKMSIEKTEAINALLDAYEGLLTDKQRDVVSYYYKEDYSLSEIAEIMKVSRAAVNDHLKRTIALLEEYEKKLKLVEKLSKRMMIYDRIKELKEPGLNELIEQLEGLE